MNNKRDIVISKLKELIKTKIYTKGSKLPPERELAETLGVSRNLLREAIITLEAWGILESVERQGVFVVTPNLSDFNDSIQFMPLWLEDLIPQVMEMRWLLNVSAAELAAHRRTEEDLKKLETAIDKLKSGNCDTEKGTKESSYWETTLHNLYIASAHNMIMDRVNEGLTSMMEKNSDLGNVTVMSIGYWLDTLISQHEQLISAIKAKNPRKAKAIMIQHLEDSIEKIEQLNQEGGFSFNYKWTLPK